MKKKEFLVSLLLLELLLVAPAYFARILEVKNAYLGTDFGFYERAYKMIIRGENPYNEKGFLYPPTFFLIFPIIRNPIVYVFFLVFGIILGNELLIKKYKMEEYRWFIHGLVLLSQPFKTNLFYMQINHFIYFLIACFLYFFDINVFISAFSLSLAACTKFFPFGYLSFSSALPQLFFL